MEVYFNELCLNGTRGIEYQDIERMKTLYACLYKKAIRVCRISTQGYSEVIRQAKSMRGTNPTVVNFLFAFLRHPYEESEIEKKQDEYLTHFWAFNGKECYGLALAWIMDSLTISICDLSWKQPLLTIERDDVSVEVRNLYDKDTFFYHQDWLESLLPLELVTCVDRPEEKKIKLRDDHGKDVLQDFSERLVKSEYVCEVMNSLPFNGGNRKFIHKIRENGLLELVLPWTDEGYGVVVRTTGRNYRETERIAEILKEKYGSM